MQRINLNRVPRITPDEALDLAEHGKVTFVDVRRAEQYRERHIAGARSMPLPEIARIGRTLSRDAPIVTY